MVKNLLFWTFLAGAACTSIQKTYAAQKQVVSPSEREYKISHEKTIGTGILLQRIGRELLLDASEADEKSIHDVLRDKNIRGLIESYKPTVKFSKDSIPSYSKIPRGIVNPHNLCYLTASTQLAWAIQSALHKKGRLKDTIGQGGSDMCTLVTAALIQHEKEDKAASSSDILAHIHNWIQKHAPEVYQLKKGVALKPDTRGFTEQTLGRYLIALNTQYKEIGGLVPFAATRLLDGSSIFGYPIVQFMPEFEDNNKFMYADDGIKEALQELDFQPQMVHMCTAKGFLETEISYIPLHIEVTTKLGPARYSLVGSLIYITHSPHTIALVRHDATPHPRWFICNDSSTEEFDEETTKLIHEKNTIPIEHGMIPSSIIYERE